LQAEFTETQSHSDGLTHLIGTCSLSSIMQSQGCSEWSKLIMHLLSNKASFESPPLTWFRFIRQDCMLSHAW